MPNITEKVAGTAIRMARVVKNHHSSQAMDLVFLDDGSRATGCPKMSHNAGTDSGEVDMPPITPSKDDDGWGIKASNPYCETDDRDAYAVVAMVGVTPVVMGYLPPQVNHMNFPDGTDTKINRHHSDFVQTTEGNANFSLAHPGGSFINLGTGAPPNLEGKDHDKVWKIKRNKTSASITLSTPKATIVVKANGDITITAQGTVAISGSLITLN